MNFGTLGRLNTLLSNLQKDAVTIGFTIAGLMIAAYAIMIMLDTTPGAKTHTERWEQLRKVFLCAIIIAGIGAIISFSRQIGGGLG